MPLSDLQEKNKRNAKADELSPGGCWLDGSGRFAQTFLSAELTFQIWSTPTEMPLLMNAFPAIFRKLLRRQTGNSFSHYFKTLFRCYGFSGGKATFPFVFPTQLMR